MNRTKILVIGGSGFIGSRLVKGASDAGFSVAYTYNKTKPDIQGDPFEVSLMDENSLKYCIQEADPTHIFYSLKPILDSDLDVHQLVNIEGVRQTRNSIDDVNSKLFIYLSTSGVFSGKDGPYSENSAPDPEANEFFDHYAITKYQGENITLDTWSNSIVARLSRVNGRDIAGNLNERISKPLKQLLDGKALYRFSNRVISPILVDNLIDALLEIINPGFSYRGIMHFAGSQRLTDYEYWLCIARYLGIDEDLVLKDSSSISDNSLCTDLSKSILTTRLLSVDEQLPILFPLDKDGC